MAHSDAAGNVTQLAEDFPEARTLSGDPATEVLVLGDPGLVAFGPGGRRELVHGDDSVGPPYWPIWSGGPLRRAWLLPSGGATRTPDGGWIIGTERGVALVTGPGGGADRLAVAVEPATQASAARGTVVIRTTRPATVAIRAVARGRTVARVTREVQAGRTDIPVPRLPNGIVDLRARATAPDGAVASHTLTVLGTRLLTRDAARRSVTAYRQSLSGQTVANARDCRRRSRTTFNCLVTVGAEDGGFRRRYIVTLRPDGWLYAIAGPLVRKIELIPPYIVN